MKDGMETFLYGVKDEEANETTARCLFHLFIGRGSTIIGLLLLSSL